MTPFYKKAFFLIILLVIIVIFLFLLTKQKQNQSLNNIITSNTMKIESPAFKNNELIPSKYTCDGENINPPLIISGVPVDAKSLAIIVDDPDAPAGTWTHWTVWNLKPDLQNILEGAKIDGIEGITSFKTKGYGGPCPPSGRHRYFFKLYALDTILDLNSNSDKSALERAMAGHILAYAELIGLYSRQ